MMDFELAKRILGAFEREKVHYVLIGSVGMVVHGIVRATQDMDFFVSPSPDNVERLKAALKSVFNDPHIDDISAEELAGDYPAIQYVPPTGDYSLDIVSRLGEAFRFEDVESQEVVVDGIRVQVATPRMLYRMKKDTVRARDRADAAQIKERFGLTEE